MSVLLIYFEGRHTDTCKLLEFVVANVSRETAYFIYLLFIYMYLP